MTAVDSAVESRGQAVHGDVASEGTQIDFPSLEMLVERLDPSAHDFHVLPRHRLLRQAQVGKRTLIFRVQDELRHLAVADWKTLAAFVKT